MHLLVKILGEMEVRAVSAFGYRTGGPGSTHDARSWRVKNSIWSGASGPSSITDEPSKISTTGEDCEALFHFCLR